MKCFHVFTPMVMLAAGMAFAPSASFAQPTTQPTAAPAAVAPTTQAIATTQPIDPRIADVVRNIQNAPDPSSVVEAYAAARAIAPDSVPVGQAYVSRLVALGVPEMAESQARELTRKAPDDGVAWAVAAFMDARRDGMRAALEEIAIAAHKAPDDAFVQRTAGQLIAYHDRDQREESYPDSLEATVAQTRGAMSGKAEFDTAYRVSSQAYAQRPTTGPVTIGRYTYNPPYDTYDNGGPRVTYDDSSNYTYDGGYYSQPYYTTPYYYYTPSYGYYGSLYYSPFYHRFNDFRFHSHFDHHDFDHHDFNHHDDHHDFNRHDDHRDFHNDRFTSPGFRGTGGRSFDSGRSFDGRSGTWSGSRDAGRITRGSSGASIDRGQRYIGGGMNSSPGSSGRSGSMGSAGSSSGSRGGGGGSMSGSSGARGGGGHR
jgi:hypothetical protein